MAEVLFYLLSIGAVAFATGVVASRQPLFSVLSLLGSFFCLSAIYLLAGYPFLAATQLLVYAGAIMVLFLYVIMLLNLGDLNALGERPLVVLGRPRVAIAGATAGILTLVTMAGASFSVVEAGGVEGELRAGSAPLEQRLDPLGGEDGIASLLFSRYALPFEAASLLLLATMIAVVMLAKRQRGTAVGGDTDWPWKGASS